MNKECENCIYYEDERRFQALNAVLEIIKKVNEEDYNGK